MNPALRLAYLCVGSAAVLFFILLFILYRNRYRSFVSAINGREYFLPELFFLGLGAIELLKINMNAPRIALMKKRLAQAKGERYADFYTLVVLSGQLTYVLTLTPLGFLIASLTNNDILGLLGLASGLALAYYLHLEVNNAIERRQERLLMDLPSALSKLALLVNAGMPLKSAWDEMACSGKGEFYAEMRMVTADIENGLSESEALLAFSDRCSVKEIRKFVSTLLQNLQKGTKEMSYYLRDMSKDAWIGKKHAVVRKGEAASQKLMIPIILMFAGVIMMIVVPVFSNMFG